MLTLSIVKELLRYEPETGTLLWKLRDRGLFGSERDWKIWNTRYAGKEAFTANGNGYKVGRIFDKLYPAHRIIWLLQTGEWPKDEIDHINHDPSDNRWKNLREVSHQENMKNASINSANTSGIVGVCFDNDRNKWQAKIQVNGKTKHLGRFSSLDDAAVVRKTAEIKYGFHNNHGQSLIKE